MIFILFTQQTVKVNICSKPTVFASAARTRLLKYFETYVLLFAAPIMLFFDWWSLGIFWYSPVVSSDSILQSLSWFFLQIHVIDAVVCAFFIENLIASLVKLAVTSDSKVCATSSELSEESLSAIVLNASVNLKQVFEIDGWTLVRNLRFPERFWAGKIDPQWKARRRFYWGSGHTV